MMTVTTDVGAVNAIANHPQVRPWLGGDGVADLGPLMATPGTVTLLLMDTMDGAFICHWLGTGIYDIHSLFTPAARRYTRQAMAIGCGYLFSEGPAALELVTSIPEHNRPAKALAQLGGFTLAGFRARWWPVPGGPQAVTWWSLTRAVWLERRAARAAREELICQP